MVKNIFKKKNDLKENSIVLYNPIQGRIVDLEDVPDEVFAQKMLGEGFAIIPSQGKVYSPFDGVIKMLFPTFHAVTIETKEGVEVLIHIGIDTVELEGLGFKSNIKVGDKVKKGKLLIDFDMEIIEKKGKSLITPIVITNMDKLENLKFEKGIKDTGEPVLIAELK